MKINLKDFYSQQQLMALLNFSFREQVRRFLKDNPIFVIRICDKPFYLRQDVDKYLDDLVKAGHLDWEKIEILKLKQVAYDISTEEWLPRCMALEFIKQKKTSLYDKAEKRIFPLIRSQKIYGFKWFNKRDLEDFLVKMMSIEDVTEARKISKPDIKIPKIPDRFFDLDN